MIQGAYDVGPVVGISVAIKGIASACFSLT